MKQFLQNSFLSGAASQSASEVDLVFNAITWISIIGFLGLMLVMLYFMIKYARKSENDKTAYIPGSHTLEALWTFIPMFIFLAIAGWGWWVYYKMRVEPENAHTIYVTGKQWSWAFTFSAGGKTINTLNEIVVPVNKTVMLDMTSQDVLHSFYLPAFRIKKDVAKGMRSKLWFTPESVGEYRIFCAEYCGTTHSGMTGYVKVVSQSDYDRWIDERVNEANALAGNLSELGRKTYEVKGCTACHKTDETVLLGPGLKGIWGTVREFEDGTKAKVDENYIRESLMNPRAKIVKGFNPVMPPFQGQLTEDEITGLIEFIKSL